MSEKGSWVWIDEHTADVLMQACQDVIAQAERLQKPLRQQNQVWALWMTLVLSIREVDPWVLRSATNLLEGLRGELTSAAFDYVTDSHRANLPGGWESLIPLWLAGRLVGSGRRSTINAPSQPSNES